MQLDGNGVEKKTGEKKIPGRETYMNRTDVLKARNTRYIRGFSG